MMQTPRLPWLTVFGLGRLRPAPGTWGSLPPIALAGVLIALGLGPADSPVLFAAVMLTVLLAFSAACIGQGDTAEAVFGKKDHGSIVADETAGQAVTLLWLPVWAMDTPLLTAFTLLLAFLAFRAMDIVKPWPADRLQRVPGGWGVLLDDLVAGAYAAIIVHACAHTAATI
ncbi:MAG: phosphatidylglycerophosphatase A [Planctomycetota bacterium]